MLTLDAPFSTSIDNQQTFSVKVFAGEHATTRDCNCLGTFELRIPPAPRGVPQIEVSFDIDKDGIIRVLAEDIHVPAVHKGTGNWKSFTITNDRHRRSCGPWSRIFGSLSKSLGIRILNLCPPLSDSMTSRFFMMSFFLMSRDTFDFHPPAP